MKEELKQWHSPNLNMEMKTLVFGHGGYPILLFPTSMGSYFENKDFKLSVKSLSQTVADCIDYTNLIEKENQKIQRIKSAYLEGIYTVEEVKEYKKSVEDKIKNLSSRQVQLKQEKTKPRKENIKEKKNFLATLKSPAISEKEKNEILKGFVDCIVFNRSTSSVDIFLYI